MRRILYLSFIIITLEATAQDNTGKWDLRRCVDYAMKNNISVKQADVQARIAALQLKQAQLAKYPNASLSSGLGTQFGRSIDRTTNIYSDVQSLYQNIQLQSGIQVYNFNRLKNTVDYAQFSAQAALMDVQKAASDAALSVCTYYLQVLAAKEQVTISQVQITQTKAQLDITQKKVLAGALPELNQVELEAQLANDSSTYITTQTTFEQNVLALKGVLNLDAAAPFEVVIPEASNIPVLPLAELQPQAVYQLALGNQPLQKGNDLRIKAADKNIQVYKAQMYPTLSLGVNLASNFYNAFKKYGYSFNGYVPNGDLVTIGSNTYTVATPNATITQSKRSFGQLWEGYGNQLSNNFGQTVGFSLSVPIFNNGQYRIAYEQSKLNYKTQLLNKEGADNTLKQNIFTSYTNAISALQKLNAGKKSVESNQKAYDFATKRYDVGLLSTLDLLTNQNNLLRAKLQQASNEYDYIFKMKLLEFYKGQGLKL
ncbi:TolC family protein [Parasediminibacterium sp. JCM 36343]|uniref:TolC family protein n=1 Tax=Parasediminibacterium sp. JCM 36343 TaxID=3374279 RepID=UPI003979D2FD